MSSEFFALVSVVGETGLHAENSSSAITAECSQIDQEERDSKVTRYKMQF